MAALPDEQRRAATVYEQMVDPAMPPGRVHPGDERHLAGAFQDNRVIPFEGVRVAEMPAAAQRAGAGDRRDVRPAAAGRPARRAAARDPRAPRRDLVLLDRRLRSPATSSTTALQSPVLIAELDHHCGVFLDYDTPQPFHIHTVLRTPHGNDYGRAWVRQWQAGRGPEPDGIVSPCRSMASGYVGVTPATDAGQASDAAPRNPTPPFLPVHSGTAARDRRTDDRRARHRAGADRRRRPERPGRRHRARPPRHRRARRRTPHRARPAARRGPRPPASGPWSTCAGGAWPTGCAPPRRCRSGTPRTSSSAPGCSATRSCASPRRSACPPPRASSTPRPASRRRSRWSSRCSRDAVAELPTVTTLVGWRVLAVTDGPDAARRCSRAPTVPGTTSPPSGCSAATAAAG